MKKFFSANLCGPAGAGQHSAAGCLPDHTRRAQWGRARIFCRIFACSICAAAKCRAFCGCRDLSGGGSGHRTGVGAFRQEYVLGAVAAEMPVSWPDRSAQGTGRCRPQLCALLPGPHHPAKRRLAHCRPSPAAGLPDRAGAAQLLGHRLRAELRPPLRPLWTRSWMRYFIMRMLLPAPATLPFQWADRGQRKCSGVPPCLPHFSGQQHRPFR